MRGEHTRKVLGRYGYSESEIDGLTKAGVFGKMRLG
jgi:hypothetical protein